VARGRKKTVEDIDPSNLPVLPVIEDADIPLLPVKVGRIDGMVVLIVGREERLVFTPLQAKRFLSVFREDVAAAVVAVLRPSER